MFDSLTIILLLKWLSCYLDLEWKNWRGSVAPLPPIKFGFLASVTEAIFNVLLLDWNCLYHSSFLLSLSSEFVSRTKYVLVMLLFLRRSLDTLDLCIEACLQEVW